MPLHTLMFGWEFPPKLCGGLGIACAGLVDGLRQQSVHVTLVLPSEGHSEQDDGTIHVPAALHPYDSIHAGGFAQRPAVTRESFPLYGENLGAAVQAFTEAAITRTMHLKPDVVHAHDWMTFGAGIAAARRHGAPLVLHVHSTEVDRTHGVPHHWIYEQERCSLHRADAVIAVSRYTKNLLVREYGLSPSRIQVVHNGTPLSPQAVGTTPPLMSEGRHRARPLVLFLGRLTVQKGPHHFLNVARRVLAERSDVLFVVAGDGYLLPELVDRACSLGLQEAVLFTGHVDSHEARALYRRASCFVMPSTSEPFGLVALEAIAHGTPVILSKHAGVAEVIDHAFKVDYWDTEKMADCILTILRETPLAAQLRSEAPRLLHRLTWQQQAGLVTDLYRSLLHR